MNAAERGVVMFLLQNIARALPEEGEFWFPDTTEYRDLATAACKADGRNFDVNAQTVRVGQDGEAEFLCPDKPVIEHMIRRVRDDVLTIDKVFALEAKGKDASGNEVMTRCSTVFLQRVEADLRLIAFRDAVIENGLCSGGDLQVYVVEIPVHNPQPQQQENKGRIILPN